ncbi:hypothetical protein P885DRAFT_72526 [Corynascus similis CBS 632.67]
MSSFTHFQRSALAFDSHPRLWTPPPDPEKPVCPYRIGFQVEIEPHTPPPPFGDPHHGPGPWWQRSDVDFYSATQVQLVMAYPLLERENALPSSSNPSATLAITGTLAVGDERGAQLVVCSVAPKTSQPPFEVVAKIFDALYYPFESRNAAHVPNNTAWQADVDYTHEAAALDHLHKGVSKRQDRLGCAQVPWLLDLQLTHQPCRKELKRSVRLVLMENIKGPSIWSVCRNPVALSRYTEQDRLAVLARVLDGTVRQRHAGVDQRDLASRNVILQPSPSSFLPEPVIVDYNIAVVFELSGRGKAPCQLSKLPENPMEFFWDTSFAEFAGWIALKWNNKFRHSQEWLKERFGGKEAANYAPVDVKLEFAEY